MKATEAKTNLSSHFDRGVKVFPLNDLHAVIVDAYLYEWLHQWHWYPIRSQRSYYARARTIVDGKTTTLYMHRLIAETPSGQVCHHRNRNSLDNREANLLNLTQNNHKLLHRNNSLKIKYATTIPEKVKIPMSSSSKNSPSAVLIVKSLAPQTPHPVSRIVVPQSQAASRKRDPPSHMVNCITNP